MYICAQYKRVHFTHNRTRGYRSLTLALHDTERIFYRSKTRPINIINEGPCICLERLCGLRRSVLGHKWNAPVFRPMDNTLRSYLVSIVFNNRCSRIFTVITIPLPYYYGFLIFIRSVLNIIGPVRSVLFPPPPPSARG